MALTLRNAIDDSQSTVDVNGADTVAVDGVYSIGSELVLVRRAVPQTLGYGQSAYQRLTVYRQQYGSTAASHTTGTALTAAPLGGGGGGSQGFYLQNSDPGAVGAGAIWKDPAPEPNVWWERNQADDGWDARSGAFSRVLSGAADVDVVSTAISDSGDALAGSGASSVSGYTDASNLAYTTSGDASTSLRSTVATAGGEASGTMTASRNSVAISIGVRVDTSGVRHLNISGLPTADPSVVGDVWNDAGTLKISAG